jgi:hypothetical protein
MSSKRYRGVHAVLYISTKIILSLNKRAHNDVGGDDG